MNSFHGFTVQHKIGSGGMSTVYMGNHGTLNYPVAVKVLHPGMSGDQGFISRFEREARAASSLNHNNIVNVIDFGSENDIYFIIMQYIDGDDLGKIFDDVVIKNKSPQFPLEISLPMLEEVAHGLKAAHQQGIVHRDIKPSNVMLNSSGHVKLADFGLARDVNDIGTHPGLDLTIPGTVVGTPSYMSPEQATGESVDARTDIFSLGVMAYHLIVGEKPFLGTTPHEVQDQIINAAIPPLTDKTCPRLTPEIEEMLTKMLAKDPANRFQNMDQVLQALLAAQESIDPSGGTLKYKREYLARFAAAPVEFAQELRDMAINSYLKRGYHYKNMGLASISDAVREFNSVLSLDTDNSQASLALQELKKQAEESGVSWKAKKRSLVQDSDTSEFGLPKVAGPGVTPPNQGQGDHHDPGVQAGAEASPAPSVPEQTMVIPERSTTAESHTVETSHGAQSPGVRVAKTTKSSRRPLLFGGLAVVLAVAAVLLVWQPWQSEHGLDTPGDNITDGSSTEAVSEPEVHSVETKDVPNDREASDESRAAAESAKARMEAANVRSYFNGIESFPGAVALFSKAEDEADYAALAINENRFDDAESGFSLAERLYREAAKRLREEKNRLSSAAEAKSEQLISALKMDVETARAEMAKVKTAAVNAGSEASAQGLFKQALERELEAKRRLDEGGQDGLRDAAGLFGEANRLFEEARKKSATIARNNEQAKAKTNAIKIEMREADTARSRMNTAKNKLDFSSDLKTTSEAFVTAQTSETDGTNEYDSGDYIAAEKKFEDAENYYTDARSEILNLKTEYDRQVAEAGINSVVEEFFTSIRDGDFATFNSILHLNGDAAENWRDLLKQYVRLENQSHEIQLQNDNSTATVQLSALYHYRARGQDGDFPINQTWEVQLTDGKWIVENVQHK